MINVTHFFPNDLNVSVLVPAGHELSTTFMKRSEREIGLRRILSYLFLNNFIDGNILDSGCWIGDNSIPWAKITEHTVYAIDPSSYNCNFIKLLTEINHISNINILQMALSGINGKICTNDHIDHGTFHYGEAGKYVSNSFTIDTLIEHSIIENIACIHLDVEGMEQDVLLSSRQAISKYQPIIVFEQHLDSDNYTQLCKFLHSYEYDTYLINEILPECRHDCRNFLATHQKINFDKHTQPLSNFCKMNNLLTKI